MYRYIVIDDEELIRKGTQKKLSTMTDFITCVGEADNGKAGLLLVRECNPDFVILDMQMPEMDGMELLPQLSKEFPDLPLIVISGYRDFDYIKQAMASQAVEYILKPFSREKIQETIKKCIDKLENKTKLENTIQESHQEKEKAFFDYDLQLLNNLLSGHKTRSTEFTSEKMGFLNTAECYLLIMISHAGLSQFDSVEKAFTKLGISTEYIHIQDEQNPHICLLLFGFLAEASTRIMQYGQRLLDVSNDFLDNDSFMTIGISDIHSSILELEKCYLEATSALNNQSICARSSALYIYSGEVSPRLFQWDKYDEFLFRIDSGMYEEINTLTKDLFTWFETLPDFTLADAKYHCYQLTNECRMILNSYLNSDYTTEKSGSVQNILNHLFSMEELLAYYQQFFTNLAMMIRPQSVYAVDDTIEKICIYLKRNYNKEITQELISYLFGLNRTYLSLRFREQTGEKFVDYLNKIRIEKAKEMLTTGQKKTYNIAKAVGYDNIKYFFRVFKKYTGLTPEQYRSNS